MKLGDSVVACDRCGAEEQLTDARNLPEGWQPLELPGASRKKDICPWCLSSLRAWWYSETLAQVRSAL
jgi:hypothetical protein